MLGIRKGTHIGTNLRDNGCCRSYINAWYGAQEAQCLFVLCDLFRNSVLHSMAVLFKRFKCPNIMRRKPRWCSESEPFKAISISSLRFRVCVFRHRSRASREYFPYSMR